MITFQMLYPFPVSTPLWSTAKSGISRNGGPLSCGALMPQHRRKLGCLGRGMGVCEVNSSQKQEKGLRNRGSKIFC